MKKYQISGLILIVLTAFCYMSIYTKSVNTVLNIEAPDIFQIDLNNNKIIDDNETICLSNSETFRDDSIAPEFAQNPDIQEIIKMHYLADEYAKSNLFLKPVKVKLTGESNQNCKFAKILSNGEDYGEKLVSAGFARIDGNFNQSAYNNNLEKIKDLKLVILNHKSYKYHTLDCEYGLQSHDYTIVPVKQIPKDALPCKFCHINKKHSNNEHSSKKINTYYTSGNISLILPDFTVKLKPDDNCSSEVCKALIKNINNAKSTIDLAIYGYTNVPKVYEALQNAKKRNVRIRLVYDRHTDPNKDYYKNTNMLVDLANASKSDFINGKTSDTNKLMHNKFIVFDNKTVFTGSMNLSPTGLSGFNANTILVIDSHEIAHNYTKEFEQMLSGKFHNNKSKVNNNNEFILGNSRVKVLFSPYDKISESIIKIIDDAQNYIYMPAFLITHSKISNALINAKRRGVDIKIILDATSTTTTHTKHDLLRKSGIQLKTEIFAGKMHSKTIIVDDKYIITGSMNFSNSGENKNDENCLIVENSQLAKHYRQFFIYLWNKIPDKWLKKSVSAESYDSIGSCFDGVDNDFDGNIDSKDSGCINNSK